MVTSSQETIFPIFMEEAQKTGIYKVSLNYSIRELSFGVYRCSWTFEEASCFSVQIDAQGRTWRQRIDRPLRSKGRKDIGLACACHARKLDSTPPARL